MPKCLFRYQWVKLPRTHLPVGKGIMGYWAKLASRAAFRKGRAKYCGYTNDVMPGMWSGGVVGLKSILGVKSRTEALEIMDTLSRFGYIRYTLDEKTKKLEYVVTDWVVKCSGAECMSGAVYATDGYENLKDKICTFEVMDVRGKKMDFFPALKARAAALKNGEGLHIIQTFELLAWNQGIGFFSSEIGPSALFQAYKLIKNGEKQGKSREDICSALREKFGEKNPEMQVLN